MLFQLKNWLSRILNDPKRSLRKFSKEISISETALLLPSCRFDFRFQSNEKRINIGEKSVVGCKFIFESNKGNISIGDNTFVNGGTSLISRNEIKIGNHVMIAWGVTIYDHNSHSLCYKSRRRDIDTQYMGILNGDLLKDKDWSDVASESISIEDDAWIGMNVIILKGVTIGRGAVVAAGSVVVTDVEPWTVVGGNPAVRLKKLER